MFVNQNQGEEKLKQVTKGLLVFLTLLLPLITMAKTKRYEIVLSTAVQAGSSQLKAGTYEMELDGGNATFYQGKKEICRVAVRTEEVAKKIDATSIEVSGDKLTAIELGHTNMRLAVSQ
jgi:hypothetical protein